MVFSSTAFLFIFLPVVMLLYYLMPGIKAKNTLLIAASLLFYAWGEPVYVLLMIGSALVNYLLALPVKKADDDESFGKIMITAAAVFNIGLLAVFKYIPFMTQTLGVFGIDCAVKSIALPIGISFYTFQSLSYVIDVYRKKAERQTNFFRLLLYICFFPQLIAGPIVRYGDIAKQIGKREISIDKTARGIRRFVFGLGKKLIIANGAAKIVLAVDTMKDTQLSAASAWLAAIAYCIQIYFDFSGYSDMALGLSAMAGFELKENFDYPYTADSLTDFWRRWHISLSQWFREYLYIPLGGSRKGKRRTGINKALVFLLTGLWHGASWTFVLWGAVHGLFVMLESYDVIRPNRWKYRIFARIYTLFVVTNAFVLFRAESFSGAWRMFRAMFTAFSMSAEAWSAFLSLLTPTGIIVVILGAVCSTPLLKPLRCETPGDRKSKAISAAGYALCVPIYVACAALLAVSSYNPFIYFRF